MSARAAVILAAGKGTRMRSSLPKVMHEIGGRPMIDWSIDLARQSGCEKIIVVISADNETLDAHITKTLGKDAIVIQDPPLGTGHAVQSAQAALKGFEGDVVVLYGDTPLIPLEAIESLFGELDRGASIGVLGFEAKDPGAYGRLITSSNGELQAIVEAKEASDEELAISFCNSGVMAGSASVLFELLDQVDNNNSKGEYYLTDIVGLARKASKTCRAVACTETDVQGVNSRLELSEVEAAFQSRRRRELLASGVTMTAPETVFLSYDTEIAPDVVIEPHVVFGPNVRVQTGARLRAFSHIEGARIASDCVIGPYARLRPGANLEAEVRIGNFVEIKNTRMGKGAKANHLSYLGDGDVGDGANIGAGTIFCNYDGFLKYQTKVGKGAFIGSNSALVAPVSVGDGAFVGSGSVITDDVAPDALVLARGRQVERPGWATSFRDKMAAIKAAKKKG